MKQSINFFDRTWGSIDFEQVSLELGIGFVRLKGNLSLSLNNADGHENVQWTNLRSNWFARNYHGQEKPLGVGQIWPDRIETENRALERNIPVFIDLDYGRMASLENLRSGKDIYFKIRLDGWASRATQPDSRSHGLEISAHIPLSEWLKRLDESGYKKTLLLEIPVPEVQRDEALCRAADHLEMAQRHLLNGHYRDCVGACRDVVSAIDFIEFSADKDRDLRSVTEGIQRKASDLRSKDERIYLLRHSFKQIAHAARHDDRLPAENESSEGGEKALPFSWEPEDARLAFSVAAALYRYAYEMKGGRNGG
jgi:hypothetical protein